MLRDLLAHVLFSAGYQVLEAEHGQHALEVARACSGQLSAVVSDVDMPVMNGLEFARLFQPLYPSIPILFITGKATMAFDLEGPGAELLTKPFRPDALLEAVGRLIAGSSAGPAGRCA
jgi:two-component system, chemotaxis family, chemotaxis protein CheY